MSGNALIDRKMFTTGIVLIVIAAGTIAALAILAWKQIKQNLKDIIPPLPFG